VEWGSTHGCEGRKVEWGSTHECEGRKVEWGSTHGCEGRKVEWGSTHGCEGRQVDSHALSALAVSKQFDIVRVCTGAIQHTNPHDELRPCTQPTTNKITQLLHTSCLQDVGQRYWWAHFINLLTKQRDGQEHRARIFRMRCIRTERGCASLQVLRDFSTNLANKVVAPHGRAVRLELLREKSVVDWEPVGANGRLHPRHVHGKPSAEESSSRWRTVSE
jgi:hypothetical protein